MRSRIVQRESDAERALRVKSGAHAVIVARENRSGSGDVRARIEHIVPGQTQGLHVAGVDLAKAEINRVTLADIVTRDRKRVVEGQSVSVSVDLVGRRRIKKKNKKQEKE